MTKEQNAWKVRETVEFYGYHWEVFNAITGERDTVHQTEQAAQERAAAVRSGCTPNSYCE